MCPIGQISHYAIKETDISGFLDPGEPGHALHTSGVHYLGGHKEATDTQGMTIGCEQITSIFNLVVLTTNLCASN